VDYSKVRDLALAHKLAQQSRTPRCVKLDQLERYVVGTQYEGRDSFMYPQTDAPLLERAPNIIYPIVRAAIRQHVDFALGDGKFPRLSTRLDDDDVIDVSEEERKAIDGYMLSAVQSSRLQDAAQDALEAAEMCGTAVAVCVARDGILEIDIQRAKWCTPTFATNGRDLDSVDIRYPYIDIFTDGDGRLRARALMFRRVVDRVADTVFQPAVIPETGEPRFVVDEAKSVNHGLGFCPVVWYAFRKGCLRVDNVDGEAVHAELLDEIDALNFALSMRGRAALYSGDPQMYEIGVDEAATPGPTGATSADMSPEKAFWRNGWSGMAERKKTARQKGAGVVWRYGNADAKVGMLTLPGDALQALDKHALDLEEKIGNVLGHTRIHPEEVKGALSGKALAFMYARTTSVVDRIRRDFWDGFLQPTLSMLLRITQRVVSDGKKLYVAGANRAAPALAKFEIDGRWICPRIRPQWGPYFDLTPTEEYDLVRMAVEASKVMPRELVLEKLRGCFPFDSVEEVMRMAAVEADTTPPAQKTEPPDGADDEEDTQT
jgi:hypothetical protein